MYFPEGLAKETPKLGLPGGQNLSEPPMSLLHYILDPLNANLRQNPKMTGVKKQQQQLH